jgi:hypothetical protein
MIYKIGDVSMLMFIHDAKTRVFRGAKLRKN